MHVKCLERSAPRGSGAGLGHPRSRARFQLVRLQQTRFCPTGSVDGILEDQTPLIIEGLWEEQFVLWKGSDDTFKTQVKVIYKVKEGDCDLFPFKWISR